MPDTLKQQLGLGEPQGQGASGSDGGTNGAPQGSTKQRDEFKAAFQAVSAKINAALQYTAAHAEQSKHNPLAAKRDKTCSAYQVALGKIDPTNPAVAQGAIDQVMAAVNSLCSTVETLKNAVEEAFKAWTAREGELDGLTDKVTEMVEWGYEKAEALKQVIDAVAAKANERKYKEALSALEQLLAKIEAIYDEFICQKNAKEEYDQLRGELDSKLSEASTCEFEALAELDQQIADLTTKIDEAVAAKDYVKALELLKQLATLVDEKLTRVKEIEAKRDEYEAARAALDPRLGEASTCEFEALADLDEQLAAKTTQTDEAAAAQDYEQAVTLVGELETLVDEKLTRVEEIKAKQQEYETARAALDPRLGEASTCEFEALADSDEQLAAKTTQTDEAAAAQDFEQAVTLVGELETLVDEKLARVEEIKAKQEEYESRLAAIQPRLQEASTCEVGSAGPIQEEMIRIQSEMEAAAEAQDYENALRLLGELETKLAEYEAILKAKADYEAGLEALQPRLTEASVSTEKLAYLDSITAEMATIQTEMEAAAAAEDYENALRLLGNLEAKVDEYFAAIEAKKAEYEAARKTALDKFGSCMVTARAYDVADLKTARAALPTKKAAMEKAAAEEDYEKALTLAKELEADATKYLADADKKQEEYDKKGEEINKALDDANYFTRDDVAREWAHKLKSDPEALKHLPTEVRNRMVEEMQAGVFSDEDKRAIDEIYKVRTLDPEFEKAEMLKREELIKRMKSDPEFKKAREEWDDMKPAERLKVMEKAVNLHADVYETADRDPPIKVKPFNTPPEEHDDGRKSWTNGTYNHGSGKLRINTNDYEKIKFNDFDKAMDLAVHETNHRYQAVLAERVKSGDIKPGDPLYNQAVAFKLNDNYYPEDPSDVYKNQPQESHSRISAMTIRKAGVGK